MVDEDDTKVVDKELVKELDEGLELIDVVKIQMLSTNGCLKVPWFSFVGSIVHYQLCFQAGCPS